MTTNSNAGISPVDRKVRGLQRYICEYGLEGRVPYAVNGANTIEDLNRYLITDPHPEYRLASCQHMRVGNWHLTWELMSPNAS